MTVAVVILITVIIIIFTMFIIMSQSTNDIRCRCTGKTIGHIKDITFDERYGMYNVEYEYVVDDYNYRSIAATVYMDNVEPEDKSVIVRYDPKKPGVNYIVDTKHSRKCLKKLSR